MILEMTYRMIGGRHSSQDGDRKDYVSVRSEYPGSEGPFFGPDMIDFLG